MLVCLQKNSRESFVFRKINVEIGQSSLSKCHGFECQHCKKPGQCTGWQCRCGFRTMSSHSAELKAIQGGYYNTLLYYDTVAYWINMNWLTTWSLALSKANWLRAWKKDSIKACSLEIGGMLGDGLVLLFSVKQIIY